MMAAGRSIEGATFEGVYAAVKFGKAVLQAGLPARRMSGVGRRGARVGAYYTPPASKSNPQGIVAYRGPVHLLNNPISPHMIAPRGRSRRRRGGAQALAFPDGGVRFGPVRHPGTAGKNFAEPSLKTAAAAARGIIHRTEMAALRGVFGA